ncbi:hypothetical protein Q1695_009919 [Nippostrongylus brasiliensis]|nr:hypothetical protein Q1695_009919 [Nippostrongylus brasiliensis]
MDSVVPSSVIRTLLTAFLWVVTDITIAYRGSEMTAGVTKAKDSPRPSQRTVSDNKKEMRIAIESVGINFKKSYAEQDMNETRYGQLYVNWRRDQRAPKDGFGGSRRSDTDKMDPYAVSSVMRSMNIIAILVWLLWRSN